MPRPNVSGENRAPLNPMKRPPVSPEVNKPSTNANPAVFSPNAPWMNTGGGKPMMPVEETLTPPMGTPMQDFDSRELQLLNKLNSLPANDNESVDNAILKNMQSVFTEALLNKEDYPE